MTLYSTYPSVILTCTALPPETTIAVSTALTVHDTVTALGWLEALEAKEKAFLEASLAVKRARAAVRPAPWYRQFSKGAR